MTTEVYRDMSVPYTEDELLEFRIQFRALPTYKDGYIHNSDIPNLLKFLKYERTTEQIQSYQAYWDEVWDGKVDEETFVVFVRALHKTKLFARECAIKADEDQNGYISADEFVRILELLVVHDSRLSGKTFEDFVKEADISKDGKVDIEECTNWIEKNLGN